MTNNILSFLLPDDDLLEIFQSLCAHCQGFDEISDREHASVRDKSHCMETFVRLFQDDGRS